MSAVMPIHRSVWHRFLGIINILMFLSAMGCSA